MKKRDMRCPSCDYYVPGEQRELKGTDATMHGECRRRPPTVFQTEVMEIQHDSGIEESVFGLAPIRRVVTQPVFPVVNQNFWCGDGRWSGRDGTQYSWGQWEPEAEGLESNLSRTSHLTLRRHGRETEQDSRSRHADSQPGVFADGHETNQ